MIDITLQDLEEYIDLKRRLQIDLDELAMLEDLLIPAKQCEERGKSSVFSASSPVEKHFKKAEELRDRISQKRIAALVQLTLIEDWLETVEDTQIQNIIKARYILGYSWKKVSEICYGLASESTPRMKIERFFDKNRKCSFCAEDIC